MQSEETFYLLDEELDMFAALRSMKSDHSLQEALKLLIRNPEPGAQKTTQCIRKDVFNNEHLAKLIDHVTEARQSKVLVGGRPQLIASQEKHQRITKCDANSSETAV